VSKQDYALRIIWDVIGKVKGTDYPDEWVVTGNHRDAWIYGAVDPSSGTAALLEAVHGVGGLLKQGWWSSMQRRWSTQWPTSTWMLR
jgi:N-acetylated-alpha-linked acidic dipeptidase